MAVRHSQKQKHTIAKAAGLCTPFKNLHNLQVSLTWFLYVGHIVGNEAVQVLKMVLNW